MIKDSESSDTEYGIMISVSESEVSLFCGKQGIACCPQRTSLRGKENDCRFFLLTKARNFLKTGGKNIGLKFF